LWPVFAKTTYPTYIKKRRKDLQKGRYGFCKSRQRTWPVAGEQGENEKGELNMKTYIKPRLRCLGLLRLVTKFSF